MINLSSEVPKFNFFDEIIYQDNTKNEIQETKNKENNFSINNISVSGPREIYAINSMLFINGKLIHEKDGKMIRENLILKISQNQILDFIVYLMVYIMVSDISFSKKSHIL